MTRSSSPLLPLLLGMVLFLVAAAPSSAQTLPTQFDLRDYNGVNYVTSVKSQEGGTCWTHGTMSAVEGNLLMTGVWSAAGEKGEPNLAEYHLDWWNGFNMHNNDDRVPPSGGGLTVHQGGDYRVSSAYLTRGEGAVRDLDGQSYLTPPARHDASYHYYYARDIEWYVAESDLSNIDTIKQAIMDHGVMGTCMCYAGQFMSNYKHYQSPSSSLDPNHAIAIIGWDDNKSTKAPKNGAWLCKNSWGASWGNSGFFWISYYDKHCCQHPEMGAISFQNVEPMQYDAVYYHDYHGWRDTLAGVTEAFNVYETVEPGEMLKSVSFFTADENVAYTVRIYSGFSGGQLTGERADKSGVIEHSGFHTIDLDQPVLFLKGETLIVYVELSHGGHPYDKSSEVPVLLGSDARVWVESASEPGQSYYRENGVWKDFYNDDPTANFCIKALTVIEPTLHFTFPEGLPDPDEFRLIGTTTPFVVEIGGGLENLVAGTEKLNYRFDSTEPFQEIIMTPLGNGRYEVALPATEPGFEPAFYFSGLGDAGATATSPYDAPDTLYTFPVCLKERCFEDDFETNLGWTVWNFMLDDGAWELADPAATSAQPEDDHTPGGTHCFVTGAAGGAADDDDVDGASTFLTSPPIALDGEDAEVSFYAWFHHTNTGTQQPLEVFLGDDTGGFVPVLEIEHAPSWKRYTLRVSDYLNPTKKLKLRFRAWDFPNDDIVEALVDDVIVEKLGFEADLWADGYEVAASQGGKIAFTLDADPAHGGRNYLVLGSLSGTTPGFTLPGGHVAPLNWDALTHVIVNSLGSPAFQGFLGTLDADGRAQALFDTLGPVNPLIVGHEMRFVFIVDTWDFSSNALPIRFEP